MKFRNIETGLAWFSLAGAFVHFVLETLYHVAFGQFLPLLIVDYIAVGLLVYAGVLSLRVRPSSAAGFLAGAWGFAACLAYIACFVFLQRYQQGQGPLFLVVVLGVALTAAFVAFALSLLLVKLAMNNASASGGEWDNGRPGQQGSPRSMEEELRMIGVIFEVWPAEGRRQEYLDIAAALRPLLGQIDGFISIERFESLYEPGKILSLSFFRDEDAIARWRALEQHRSAQARGRAGIFRDYRLRIAGVIRDYGMFNREQVPTDSKEFHR